MITGWTSSTPPVIMISARSSSRKRRAMQSADSAEQKRWTWVTFGPFRPCSMEALLAEALETVLGKSIGTRPPPPSVRQPRRNSSELTTPPKPQPRTMPIRVRSSCDRSMPASCKAIPAATTANRLHRSNLRAFRGGMKSAARKPSAFPQRCPPPPATPSGIGVSRQIPPARVSRRDSSPTPAGEIAAMPVTTMSWNPLCMNTLWSCNHQRGDIPAEGEGVGDNGGGFALSRPGVAVLQVTLRVGAPEIEGLGDDPLLEGEHRRQGLDRAGRAEAMAGQPLDGDQRHLGRPLPEEQPHRLALHRIVQGGAGAVGVHPADPVKGKTGRAGSFRHRPG